MTESLSPRQARKLVLLSQRLPPGRQGGRSVDATLSALEHLGYVQIDTISVVRRAHHHTLWNRNPRYRESHLDQLLSEKKIFEYWSHAAAYLPMCDYRFSLPRKEAIAAGDENHWYDRDDPLMKSILQRIAGEGPLMARDFEHSGSRIGEWSSKPAKRALENLYMQGDLMVPRRVKFQKVYDLTDRVLPDGVDTTMPAPEEYTRFLVVRYLQANGIGKPVEFGYLRKNAGEQISETLKAMLHSGELVNIKVSGRTYFALPSSLELLNRPLARSKLKILSPFDNLLIQRRRIRELFDFDYLIECYTPRVKRRYGYFSLPILWDGRLVARMDCSAERKESILHIHHLALEPGLSRHEDFARALTRELPSFLGFNSCTELRIHRTSPEDFKDAL